MNLTKIAIAVAVFLALTVVILWQRVQIKDLEAEQSILKLSNTSLQQQAEHNLKFIESANLDLQACMDSKDKLVKSFESVNTLVRKAKPTNINTQKVVDDATLRRIIDTLNKPLPLPVSDRMQQ